MGACERRPTGPRRRILVADGRHVDVLPRGKDVQDGAEVGRRPAPVGDVGRAHRVRRRRTRRAHRARINLWKVAQSLVKQFESECENCAYVVVAGGGTDMNPILTRHLCAHGESSMGSRPPDDEKPDDARPR